MPLQLFTHNSLCRALVFAFPCLMAPFAGLLKPPDLYVLSAVCLRLMHAQTDHTHTHVHMYTNTHTWMHAHLHIPTHTGMHAHADRDRHTETYARTHTHTHTQNKNKTSHACKPIAFIKPASVYQNHTSLAVHLSVCQNQFHFLSAIRRLLLT